MAVEALSEGLVALRRPHVGPGQLVHRATRGGFVTMQYQPCYDLEDAGAAPMEAEWDQNTYVRLVVGRARTALIQRIPCNEPGFVVKNVWVEAGEELWASASILHRLAVFGFSSDRPFS